MKNQTRIEDSAHLKVVLAHRKAEPGILGSQLVSHICLTAALALGLALPGPSQSMADDENSEWAKALAGVSTSKPSTSSHTEESKPSAKKTTKPVAPKKASKE